MIDEQTGTVGDKVALGSGAGGIGAYSLAQWADIASDLIPILSVLMIVLTCLWYTRRLYLSFKHPKGAGDGD